MYYNYDLLNQKCYEKNATSVRRKTARAIHMKIIVRNIANSKSVFLVKKYTKIYIKWNMTLDLDQLFIEKLEQNCLESCNFILVRISTPIQYYFLSMFLSL